MKEQDQKGEERKKEMQEFLKNFEGMPDRLLKYNEILIEGKDASPYCYQDTMSFRRLAVGLTTYCNSNCKWCYRDDPKYKDVINKHLPLEKLKKMIDNTKGKFRMVHIAELGEPLLYPHLIEAIKLLKKLSNNVKITTNGRLLNEKIVNEMVEAGLTHIEVSVDAFTEEKNKEFRGSSLKELVKNIVYISENTDLFLQINTVVCSLNIDSLDNLVDALKEAKNLNVIHTIPLFETDRCKKEGITRVSDEEYKALLRRLEKEIKEKGLKWKLIPSSEGVSIDPVIEMKRRKNICFACFEDPSISIDGKLLPCDWLRRFDGPDASVGFEKAWNHPNLLKFRKDMLEGNYPKRCGQLCYLEERKGEEEKQEKEN